MHRAGGGGKGTALKKEDEGGSRSERAGSRTRLKVGKEEKWEFYRRPKLGHGNGFTAKTVLCTNERNYDQKEFLGGPRKEEVGKPGVRSL